MFKIAAVVLCVVFAASDQCNTHPKHLKPARAPVVTYNYPKIISAKEINITAVPFLVLVEYLENNICTGSILSEKFILTAADCTARYNIKLLNIRYGTSQLNSGGTVVKFEKIFIYRGFDSRILSNDISVVQLAESIKFSKTAKPIALRSHEPNEGEKGFVPGWDTLKNNGGILSSKLKLVPMRVADYTECLEKYLQTHRRKIFCARARISCVSTLYQRYCDDGCLGDSGGPLVINGAQSGIFSLATECTPEVLRVYPSIARFRAFINKSTDGSVKWV